MVDESVIAAVAGLSVTASFPFLLYGAWIMIDTETVTWTVLMRHLRYIGVGLVLTTVPIVGWMIPRLFVHLSGLAVIHAFLGVQAYALLAFALTGIPESCRRSIMLTPTRIPTSTSTKYTRIWVTGVHGSGRA